MAFAKYGKPTKIPRDEHVDIVLRTLSLNPEAPEHDRRECVEIREFIKESGVYGHGVVLPVDVYKDILRTGERVLPQ